MINSPHLQVHYLLLHFHTLPLLPRTLVILAKLSCKPQPHLMESHCRTHPRISDYPLPSHFPLHKLHLLLPFHHLRSFADPPNRLPLLLHTIPCLGFSFAATIALGEAILSQKVLV